MVTISTEPLLEVIDMSISFKMYERGLKQVNKEPISNLSLSLNKGEILAIVGSSGGGKSLLAHGILGLLPRNSTVTGTIKYKGEKLDKRKIEALRGRKIALIPQSISHLDPLIKIGKQVQGFSRSEESNVRQKESFKKYNLYEGSEKLYPFQLSGGMARRVLIATADQNDVEIIIADEPTPGLDLEMAMKALKYFRDFADQGKGVLMITHDIDLALNIADKIAVFYAGTILEIASVVDFSGGIENLRHPYTKALYEALPQNRFKPMKELQLSGVSIPEGCMFYNRCENSREQCKVKIPMRQLRGGMVRCLYAT